MCVCVSINKTNRLTCSLYTDLVIITVSEKRKSTQSKQPNLNSMESCSNIKGLVSKSPTISQMTSRNSDLISKQSTVVRSPSVSDTQKSPSVISTAPTATLSSDSKKKLEIEPDQSVATKKPNSILDANQKTTNVQNGAQTVSSTMNISSDFKGVSNIANKAMAIVQPTENNDANSSAYTEVSDKSASSVKDASAKIGEMAQHELQQQQLRTISRSVSDLSGKQKQMVAESMGVESERATALEEIFNGSAPNLANINSIKNEGATKSAKVGKTKAAPDDASVSGSLESIELPEKLVESIKQAESKNAVPSEQPSPNLLLGQVAPTNQVQVVANESQKKQSEENQKESENKVRELSRDKKIIEPTSEAEGEREKNVSAIKAGNVDKTREDSQNDRPANPMGREARPNSKIQSSETASSKGKALEKTNSRPNLRSQADVKNHQIVVNKLDKRKTNLEIVDLRDASVTGNLISYMGNKNKDDEKKKGEEDSSSGWISMDGVAVVGNQSGTLIGPTSSGTALGQAPSSQSPTGIASNIVQQTNNATINQQQQQMLMSPSDIIDSRFNVDYRAGKKKKVSQQTATTSADGKSKNLESIDSNQEEYNLNNIENELEQDNKMKNRKYFVYIVHDGHFTAKKECIARIELPQKRRITLAEVRQLISNSQDISLSSLRRSRFKFVTETYRLLNENEDAAVLHQVYPTQGVFLKLNIPEQENPVYPFKGHTSRLSSGAAGTTATSSLSHTTISSRRRANVRNLPSARDNNLPAIEVDYASGGKESGGAMSYGRMRTSSVGRRTANAAGSIRDRQQPLGSYRRSKSSVQTSGSKKGSQQQQATKRRTSNSGDKLPAIGRSSTAREMTIKRSQATTLQRPNQSLETASRSPSSPLPALSNAASDLGNKVISGAKGLFNATFHR